MEIEGGNKDVQDLGKFSVEEYNKKLHSLNGVSSGKLTFDEEGGIRIRHNLFSGLKPQRKQCNYLASYLRLYKVTLLAMNLDELLQ
ncbi:hypothetical protein Ancab_033620, partial [Ancistrocladus abbreviatus]